MLNIQTLTFADIVSLESTVMDAGVDVTDGTAAYVCTPKVYGAEIHSQSGRGC